MNKINFHVTGTRLQQTGADETTSGSRGYDLCTFQFDEAWNALYRTVVFGPDWEHLTAIPIGKGNCCKIPDSCLTEAGLLYIGVFGTFLENETTIHKIATNYVLYRVREGVMLNPELVESDFSIYDAITGELAGIVESLTEKADRTELPTQISTLENDSGYLTEDALETAIEELSAPMAESISMLEQAVNNLDFDGYSTKQETGKMISEAIASYDSAMPCKALYGTQESPVVLAELDTGIYVIYGPVRLLDETYSDLPISLVLRSETVDGKACISFSAAMYNGIRTLTFLKQGDTWDMDSLQLSATVADVQKLSEQAYERAAAYADQKVSALLEQIEEMNAALEARMWGEANA